MPPTPQSPMPRMAPASVATIRSSSCPSRPAARSWWVQRHLGWRDETGQAELTLLSVGERGAPVQPGIGKDLAAAQLRVPPAVVIRPERPHHGPFGRVFASPLRERDVIVPN